MDRTAGLVSYSSEAVRGSMVAWILWSGLLDGQDWALYSVVDGAMNDLPCSARTTGWDPGPIWLIVWGLESGKSVH